MLATLFPLCLFACLTNSSSQVAYQTMFLEDGKGLAASLRQT